MIVFSFHVYLCMTVIYVKIRNLWLIMATHCIFLNYNSSYNICEYVNCVEIGCEKNLKMLLQDNCINNGVANGLK